MRIEISDRHLAAVVRFLDQPSTRAVEELRASLADALAAAKTDAGVDVAKLDATPKSRTLSLAAVELVAGLLRGQQPPDTAPLSLEALKQLGA